MTVQWVSMASVMIRRGSFSQVELGGLEPPTPCLQSMTNMSSTVYGLASGVPSVHLSPAPFRPVGVGYGCHRDWLKSAEAGPRSCAEVAGRHGTAGYRRRLEPENRLHNDGPPKVALKMATGTGKIVVIAVIIAWLATRSDGRSGRAGTANVDCGVAVWTRRDTRASVVIKRLLRGGE